MRLTVMVHKHSKYCLAAFLQTITVTDNCFGNLNDTETIHLN